MISSVLLMFAVIACGEPQDPKPITGPDAGVAGPKCGNNMCEAGETQASCPADCHPTCGNNMCETGETTTSCPADCHPACGNNMCETGETPQSCPADCHAQATCGNSVCESGETVQSCPSDCAATMITDNRSTRTVYRLFVVPCGSGTWGTNWLSPYSLPANYYFTLSKIPPGCYWFRADVGSDAWVWQDTTGYNFDAAHTFTWTLH